VSNEPKDGDSPRGESRKTVQIAKLSLGAAMWAALVLGCLFLGGAGFYLLLALAPD
jgi:hypothetical protein